MPRASAETTTADGGGFARARDLTIPNASPTNRWRAYRRCPSVPAQPIVAESAHEYGTFEHLTRYPWVVAVFRYSRPEELGAWLPGALAGLARTRR